MLESGFLKPNISISNIGKRKFWIGCVMGLFFTIIFNFFLDYSMISLRTCSIDYKPYILSSFQNKMYALFYSSFSISIGFGITIIYWLRGINKKIKKRYYQLLTISNIWFIIIFSVYLLARFGVLLAVYLHIFQEYENDLDFIKSFWLILLLLPLYIFTSNWNGICLLFKINNWIYIAIICYIVLLIFLYYSTNSILLDFSSAVKHYKF